MEKPIDLLPRVVAELSKRTGSLRTVSDDTGLAYDTVLRIKNGEGDPGYDKVRKLYAYLFHTKLEDAPAEAKAEA